MRKIEFNNDTITEIREYINSGHTMDETCNRFTLKYDTLRRVMHENDIAPYRKDKSHPKEIDADTTNLICNLYSNTDTSLQDIVKASKLEYYVVLEILHKHFSEEYINSRKSRLYRNSKLGDKNPMRELTGEKHPNYKGLVDDGQGYLMIKKPSWYTGRPGSYHVFYHSVVMAEHLGLTEIPKGFVVHHIDGNKHNNDISNLALVSTGGHSKWHSLLNRLCKVQRLSNQE